MIAIFFSGRISDGCGMGKVAASDLPSRVVFGDGGRHSGFLTARGMTFTVRNTRRRTRRMNELRSASGFAGDAMAFCREFGIVIVRGMALSLAEIRGKRNDIVKIAAGSQRKRPAVEEGGGGTFFGEYHRPAVDYCD